MTALLLNTAAAWTMVGVIWLVQLVVYPAFRLVPDEGWSRYHDQHSRRITSVVGPAMLVELATSVLLVAGAAPDGVPGWMPWAALAATLVAVGMTGAVHSPDHGRLSKGRDARLIDRQIGLGWIRTAAWTAHGVIALLMLSA
jgi:uncharacterized membrane protein